MQERNWHRIISGERKGAVAAVLRSGLWLLSLMYACLVRFRLWLYAAGLCRRQRVSVPVICVGNLSVGGTGKTPMAELLVRRAEALALRPAVVSRGYKSGSSTGSGQGDEARMLCELIPGLLHIEDPDRVRGARRAIDAGAGLIILDDGFSHLRLKRDCDLLLIDALCPFGHGHLLPRGLLREPLSSVARADWVLLTRCDVVPQAELTQIEQRLHQLGVAENRILHGEHRPCGLLAVRGPLPVAEVSALAGRRVWAVSGLAHPDGFHRTLQGSGAELVGSSDFPDHFAFDPGWCAAEWPRLEERALKARAEMIVVTHKDAVKLGESLALVPGALPVVALRVEMAIREGPGRIDALLQGLIAKAGVTNRA